MGNNRIGMEERTETAMLIYETSEIERTAIALNEMRKDLAVEFDDLRGKPMTDVIVHRIAQRIGELLVTLEVAMKVDLVNHVGAEITLRGNTLAIDLVGRTDHGHRLIGAAERLIDADSQ